MPLWHYEEVASRPTSHLRLPVVSLANPQFNHSPKPMHCFIFILLFSYPLTSPCLALKLHALIISLNLHVHTLHHIFTSITFGNIALTTWLFACLIELIVSIVVPLHYLHSSLYLKESSISLLFDYNSMCFLLLFHCFESWLCVVCFELVPKFVDMTPLVPLTNFRFWQFLKSTESSQSAIVRVDDVNW